MPKPKKERHVQYAPPVFLFKPQGIPARELKQVVLHVDESEAIRLVDHEGMDLETAAGKLKVSRATCARIVESAHKKIAEAFAEGKAIRIEGGAFVFKQKRYRCGNCGYFWVGTVGSENKTCPRCGGLEIKDLNELARGFHGGRGFGRGQGQGQGQGQGKKHGQH
jgi:predicted DNA-binding protein (UPF0251 family)